jgi:hypothetical protein
VNWGVLAIVLGILGLLSNLFSGFQAGMMFVMPMDDIYGDMAQYKTGDAQGDEAIEDMMAMQGEMMRNMQDMAPMNLVVAALLALLSIALLVGGVFLCKRKRSASRLLQTWAYLKILIGGIGIWLNYKLTSSYMNQFGDHMNNTMSSIGSGSTSTWNLGSIMSLISQGMFFVGMLWVVWLPVFFLTWLHRENVKEEMNSGPGWS